MRYIVTVYVEEMRDAFMWIFCKAIECGEEVLWIVGEQQTVCSLVP